MKGKYKVHKSYWCCKCDANHITNGVKCEVCGYKSTSGKVPRLKTNVILNAPDAI